MKLRLSFIVGMISLRIAMVAQEPVSWSYNVKTIGPNLYELHIAAKIDTGWHIYSGRQPKTAIAVPTSISFFPSPLLIFKSIKEQGKIIHYKDENAGIEQDQYSNRVDFVEVVELKASVKIHISGIIKYQACTDNECLPPASSSFSIDLPPAEGPN